VNGVGASWSCTGTTLLKAIASIYMCYFQDLVEAVDHIPVHIGAVSLKRTLYNVVIPRWNKWANNFPLHIDNITMHDKWWVTLEPSIPDCSVIARHFFKARKKGAQMFKSGKTIVHFHIPNEIYDAMLKNRDGDEWPAEQNTAGEKLAAGKGTVVRVREIEPSMAADFTVGILSCLQQVHY